MEESVGNGLISKYLSSKIELIEFSLHQTLYTFREFVTEFEQMHMMCESVKKQMVALKEKCESKCCNSSEELKKVIETKENTIQLVASTLTQLNETKDFNILTEVFRLLLRDSKSQDNVIVKEEKGEINSDINIGAMTIISPKEESPQNMSVEVQDLSEIEGTPTGRRSPIIQSKKLKSTNNTTPREKKKCPQNWLTPEKKSMKVKLVYPTPTRSKDSGRLRQQRIPFVREKVSAVVDLTTTPQFSKGRHSQTQECLTNIKQEVVENDDTIMPSPTSGAVPPPAFKSKESAQKFKKPLSLIRGKAEVLSSVCKEMLTDDGFNNENQETIMSLKECPTSFAPPEPREDRESPFQADSLSVLRSLNDVEARGGGPRTNSTVKRPLVENVNFGNVPGDSEASMSVLRADFKMKSEPLEDNNKRTKCQVLEPLYKEPTVRKKSEKKALPGWSCEQCQNFYGELYKDNFEMQAKKMEECSKHRGRNNPVRPKTPPGYWEPRWDVPQDTEEFNRRNNAI